MLLNLKKKEKRGKVSTPQALSNLSSSLVLLFYH